MSEEGTVDPGEADELADLVAAGTVIPPTVFGPVPMPTHSTGDNRVSEMLLAMRDEERS